MSNLIYLLSPLKQEGSIFLPMIFFKNVAKKIDFSKSDTLLFTSKQAVESANEIDETWKSYPSIAIGEATKKRIEELGGTVIYTPSNFYGKVLAEEIKEYFSDRKILYLRPKKSLLIVKPIWHSMELYLKSKSFMKQDVKGICPSKNQMKMPLLFLPLLQQFTVFLKTFLGIKAIPLS